VTPKGVVSWQPNPNNLLYISAEKGYRVGGINAGVGDFCEANLAQIGIPIGADGHRDAPSSYRSDSLWSYEIGGKNAFLDQRLQIDSSLFWIDWRDIQQNVFLGECGLQYTANLGRVRSVGGDVAALIRATDALTLNLTAAYVDAKYSRTVCATDAVVCTGPNANGVLPVVSTGDRLVGAPWKFVLSGDYLFAPIAGRKPYVHIDYTHTTAQTALLPLQDTRNGVSDPTIPGLPETNDLAARAGLRWGGFDLSLFGQNLTDSHPIMFVSRDFAAPYVQQYWERSVRPRTVGITLTYRY
jgi:iron complex outermembrane receptor protein